jgi:2'-5' RNA ligase
MIKETPPHSMFYLAIICPSRVNDKVLRFKNWMKEQFGCTVALRSPAHLTLIPPFWLEKSRESLLIEKMRSFVISKEIFIELNGFSHFGKKVLFIHVQEDPLLEELRSQVEEHFRVDFSDVIKKEDRLFHPHVTIANRDMMPQHFFKAWEYFSEMEFREQFLVEEVSILKLTEGRWTISRF